MRFFVGGLRRVWFDKALKDHRMGWDLSVGVFHKGRFLRERQTPRVRLQSFRGVHVHFWI